MTLWLGGREVEIMQLGRGHTKGDTVVWLPKERVLFSGDLVEYDATPYCGDAHFADWPATLDAIARTRRRRSWCPAAARRCTTPSGGRDGLDGHPRVRDGDVRVGARGRGGRQGPAHRLQRRPTPP